MTTKIKTGPLTRSMTFERDHLNSDDRTVAVTFSSENPVDRAFGAEILDHSQSSVRMGRLAAGAAVLVDHDPKDLVGVVEQAEIDESGRIGRALLRFGNSQRASEIFADVESGVRRQVSVGYQIHRMAEERSEESTSYRVIDWEPFEISITAIAADPFGAGVMRSEDHPEIEIEIEQENPEMEPKKDEVIEERSAPVPEINVDQMREKAIMVERGRISAIGDLGDKHGCRDLASKAIKEGVDVSDFRAQVLEHLGSLKAIPAANDSAAEIGMTEKEVRSYSMTRMINALANPGDHRAREAAAFEIEASNAAAEKMGKQARGAFVPYEVMKRDITVGSAPSAGNLTETIGSFTGPEFRGESFIEILRNSSAMMGRCQVLSGLVGDVAIPRQNVASQGSWLSAEQASAVQSEMATDFITMRNRTVGAYSKLSRKMLQQSSMDIEGMVQSDLGTALGLAIDAGCLFGDGLNGAPTGLLNQTGIAVVPGGPLTWDMVIDLETAVTSQNANGSVYLTNAKVAGAAKKTRRDSGSGLFLNDGGSMNGYPVVVSNQVPDDRGAGTDSALIFVDMSQCIIGTWGALDLLVDPYGGGNSLNGDVTVRVFQDADFCLRHFESCAVADIAA